jgi:hypothetical protein
MAQYALIKDDIITNLYDSIPTSFGNEVSGFQHLSDAEREAFGFFKVDQPDRSKYNPELHGVTKEEHKIVDGKPVYTFEYTSRYTEEQLLSINKQKFWNIIRDSRNYLLGSSDWTVMPDVVASKGQEWYNAWSTYRQALRDITNNDNLFSDNAGVVSDKLFPTKPEL